MKPDSFFAEHDGKYCTAPGGLGKQCVDLANEYCLKVLYIAEVHANAVDWWTQAPDYFARINNAPDNFPQKGDLVIWSKALDPYGHIAVATGNKTDTNGFESFDQNWPLGSVCHFQEHNYTDVIGWLRFTPAQPQPPQEGEDMTQDQQNALNVLQPLVDSKQYGNLEGAARAATGALTDIANLKVDDAGKQNTIDNLNKQIASLTTDNKDLATKLNSLVNAVDDLYKAAQ